MAKDGRQHFERHLNPREDFVRMMKGGNVSSSNAVKFGVFAPERRKEKAEEKGTGPLLTK